MTTVQHPKYMEHDYKRNGEKFETSLTTYDNVSSSPAKLKYTFGNGKGKRFPTINPIREKGHDLVGYSLPSTRGTKACSFGIGERFADSNIKLRHSKYIQSV